MGDDCWGPRSVAGVEPPAHVAVGAQMRQVRRVIARVAVAGGSVRDRHVVATGWTSEHVRVWLDGAGVRPRSGDLVWVPAGQVRRDDSPARPGETIPYPPGGPTHLVQISEACRDGHPVTFPAWALAADNVDRTDSAASAYRWRCPVCGGPVTGPPHRESAAAVALSPEGAPVA